MENNLAVGIIPYEFLERSIAADYLFQVQLTEEIAPRQLYLAFSEAIPMSAVCREFLYSIGVDLQGYAFFE